jgi:hypothetical protein
MNAVNVGNLSGSVSYGAYGACFYFENGEVEPMARKLEAMGVQGGFGVNAGTGAMDAMVCTAPEFTAAELEKLKRKLLDSYEMMRGVIGNI